VKGCRYISVWKNAGLIAWLVCLVQLSSTAQCTSGSLSSITYDTVVVGSGNNDYAFSLSKFDPAIGTLVSVSVNSVVSVNYGFTLKNTNTTPITFSISVGRNDDIQSPALQSPYSNSMQADVGTFVLAPNQTIIQPSTTVINRYDNTVGVSDVANFIGSGNVDFSYSPQTYTNHSGSTTYQYSASANDTVHFLVTYNYCSNVVLSPDITSFDASRENQELIQLLWTTVNEQQGRIYEIEKSSDGIHFKSAGNSPDVDANSSGNYSYHYPIAVADGVKIWFRLKITDLSGNIKYSNVKWIDLSDPSRGIYLYPNPSDQFINIVFNSIKDCDVEIISASGAIVQHNQFTSVNSARIAFVRTLPGGVYFARIFEPGTGNSRVLSFVVK